MQATENNATPTAIVGIKGKNVGGIPTLRQQLKLYSAEVINGLGVVGEDKTLSNEQRLTQAEAQVMTLERIAKVVRVLSDIIDGPAKPKGGAQ